MSAPTLSIASEPGGRAVLDEAIGFAKDALEADRELAPFVVTKEFGDCEVESLGEGGLERARTRMEELGRSAGRAGHVALTHVGAMDLGETAIFVELGRLGRTGSEVFVQRFRPRRGLFRPFKLLGKVSPATEIGSPKMPANQSSGSSQDRGNGTRPE